MFHADVKIFSRLSPSSARQRRLHEKQLLCVPLSILHVSCETRMRCGRRSLAGEMHGSGGMFVDMIPDCITAHYGRKWIITVTPHESSGGTPS